MKHHRRHFILTRTVGTDDGRKVLQGTDHVMAPVGLEVVHFDAFQHGWHFDGYPRAIQTDMTKPLWTLLRKRNQLKTKRLRQRSHKSEICWKPKINRHVYEKQTTRNKPNELKKKP